MAKTKTIKCTKCNGTGYTDTVCEACDGAGEITLVHTSTKCPECDGFGCDYCDDQGWFFGWHKD